MFVLLVALLNILNASASPNSWKLRPLNIYTSTLTVEQRRNTPNSKEVVVVGASTDGLETLSTKDNGNSWQTLSIPKRDYTVVSNAPKDRLNFENLPFNFVTQSVMPYGETGLAVTGRFYYLHSSESFNGVALKSDITSNSWKLFSLSTNVTVADESVFATHSAFPTQETWYTVLSTVPPEKQIPQKKSNFMKFDIYTGEAAHVSHPLTEEQQAKLPTSKQIVAIYKTKSAGQEWDKVFEVEDGIINDFQCFDDITCVAIVQRLDGTAKVFKTNDGGKNWSTIYENTDATIRFQSVFVQGPSNIWLVAQGEKPVAEGTSKSLLFHSTEDTTPSWNIVNPEVEGLQRIFFYNGGEGMTDDDYRFVEGLIVTETPNGEQMLQQIYAL